MGLDIKDPSLYLVAIYLVYKIVKREGGFAEDIKARLLMC